MTEAQGLVENALTDANSVWTTKISAYRVLETGYLNRIAIARVGNSRPSKTHHALPVMLHVWSAKGLRATVLCARTHFSIHQLALAQYISTWKLVNASNASEYAVPVPPAPGVRHVLGTDSTQDACVLMAFSMME
jgi:hypothetical protein